MKVKIKNSIGDMMKKNSNNKSVIDICLYLIIKVKRDDIFALASQLAYHLMLSFFPFLIFLVTLILN